MLQDELKKEIEAVDQKVSVIMDDIRKQFSEIARLLADRSNKAKALDELEPMTVFGHIKAVNQVFGLEAVVDVCGAFKACVVVSEAEIEKDLKEEGRDPHVLLKKMRADMHESIIENMAKSAMTVPIPKELEHMLQHMFKGAKVSVIKM